MSQFVKGRSNRERHGCVGSLSPSSAQRCHSHPVRQAHSVHRDHDDEHRSRSNHENQPNHPDSRSYSKSNQAHRAAEGISPRSCLQYNLEMCLWQSL